MKKYHVLVVDDDKGIQNFLRYKLSARGYHVSLASNGVEALEMETDEHPDIIILDLLLPQKDGLSVLREIRKYSDIPVIILTAKGSDPDRIKGLDSGADDYLAKPFNPDVLVARIEALRRRLDSQAKMAFRDLLVVGNIKIDFSRHYFEVEGKEKHLAHIEWQLLAELADNPGKLLTHEYLLTRVWGAEYIGDTSILRSWVNRLRKKIGSKEISHHIIQTIHKSGYMFNPAVD